MTAPEFMPVLGFGKHNTPAEGACVMEYVSILAGEEFTDNPKCTLWILGMWAREVNDRLGDEGRSQLIPLIPRLIGTEADDHEDEQVINRLLAGWADARYPGDSSRRTVEFLTAALDEYDRLTGRTTTGMTPDDYAALEAKRREMAGQA